MSDASWLQQFPGLAVLDAETRRILQAQSRVLKVPKGAVVFGPGRPADNMLLLLEGVVRVHQTSDTGRDIVLYRVEAGESCVMTTACLLSHENYSAEGLAETEARAVAIPRSVFQDLLAGSEPFRNFVFAAFSQRMNALFHLVEEVAFGRIDMRLAGRLVALSKGDSLVLVTHQQLATELGTAREVISRQLHDFHQKGWIAQGRGRIELLDVAALERLSQAV